MTRDEFERPSHSLPDLRGCSFLTLKHTLNVRYLSYVTRDVINRPSHSLPNLRGCSFLAVQHTLNVRYLIYVTRDVVKRPTHSLAYRVTPTRKSLAYLATHEQWSLYKGILSELLRVRRSLEYVLRDYKVNSIPSHSRTVVALQRHS